MSLDILNFINNIVLPSYCIVCGNYGPYICRNCMYKYFNINFYNICHVCGVSTYKLNLHKECEDSTNLDKLLFFCEYNWASKKIIEEVKYRGSYSIAKEVADHMVKYFRFKQKDYWPSEFLITCVPSHKYKFNERGFNQSELLAKEIALQLNIEFVDLLSKTQNTQKQAGASKTKRVINLGNFKIKKIIKNRIVIIIDDVHTTGSTLNNCAAELKRNGIEIVWGFTFAKSLNYSQVSIN